MKPVFEVSFNDKQGLGVILREEGFAETRVDEAKHLLRVQFEKAARRLFIHILDVRMPISFVVDFAIDEDNPQSGFSLLASYNKDKSSSYCLYFRLYKPSVISAIKHGNNKKLRCTLMHELLHAADHNALVENNKIIKEVQGSCLKNPDSDIMEALCDTLHLFSHFRNEGVAILGSRLLTKIRFGCVAKTIERFNVLYELTLLKSKKWCQNEKGLGAAFNDDVYHSAYQIAPSILVLVLEKREEIDKDVAERLLWGLDTGTYKLNDDEIRAVIKASLSLSLSDYIQGVTLLGEKIAPVQPFLEFCGLVQKESENDNIKAFAKLIGQPQTAKVFHEVVQKIVDAAFPETVLDERYKAFDESQASCSAHHQLKAKVGTLYAVLKTDEDTEKKRIAQWALTYLFKEQDLIHDDMKGLGLVDDETVIDYALKIMSL